MNEAKDNAEWLNWISQGKLLYVDKERIQTLIDKQRKNLAEVEYLDLDSVAKIVNEFETPKLLDENSSKEPSFRITPEEDVAYMDAVENNDMEKAQSLVDKAAEEAG
ncbi:MAG: hypothetical protein J5510_04775 [Prevotella sp.]|nr:hypothetical protein [Prevotella sp.]